MSSPKKAPLPKINIKGNNFNNNVFIFFNIVDIVHSPTGRTCFCVSQEARGSLSFFLHSTFAQVFLKIRIHSFISKVITWGKNLSV